MNDVKCGIKGQESGVILITVLWLIALISVLVMGALQEWRTELKLAANFQAKTQCRRLAEGGVYYAIGKILAKEIATNDQQQLSPKNTDKQKFWLTDGSTHALELASGRVEISITDEAGKFNFDRTSKETFTKIFDAMDYPFDKAQRMANSVLNWRAGNINLNNGDFLKSINRDDYTVNNRFIETVEEILWLPDCAGLDPVSLSENFTVQMVEGGVNLNTASPAVIIALGLTAPQAQQIIKARSVQSFKNFQDLGSIVDVSQMPDLQSQTSFNSSVFYTIFSSGSVSYNKSKHTVKAIVRLDLDKSNLWSVLYWSDDYPIDNSD